MAEKKDSNAESEEETSIHSGITNGTGAHIPSGYSVSSDHIATINGDFPDYVDPVVDAKEQKLVFYSKLLVFAVLVLAMAATATSAAILVKREEQDDFEIQVSEQV
jgi:hypothetical protein